MDLGERYHLRPAAASVCGSLATVKGEELERTVARGLAAGLDLHAFKRSAGLPRVERVLGLLRGLAPTELLDVGGGRGVFLWPLVEALPELPLTLIDADRRAVERFAALRRGGLSALRPLRMDATALGLADGSFDVVTALEVLEHIPEVWRAVDEAVRVARRFVIISVPSRPDDNPQHLRLMDEQSLTALCRDAGARDVRCEHVLNHLIAVVKVSR
jgi:2-polyprenyl-3-methyl-5-hydroxy-6-metoxy-1,4-benzoquinol methylase